MKRERLTHYQAKCVAQELADETDAPCLIYRQWSITGIKHYGVVTQRDVRDWQLRASVEEWKYPKDKATPASEPA